MSMAKRSAVTLAATVLFVTTVTAADPPDPLLRLPPVAKSADPLLAPPPLPACPDCSCDKWRLAADLGLPAGVRLQRRLGETNWWAEGGVGAWWIVPFASACLRYDCTLLKRERNLFAVRPGVSATLTLIGPAPGAGVDAELIWQHTFGGRLTTELGLRVGMTAVFAGGDGRFVSGVLPVPVACLMWSWQF
jgi:hypothetical protein